MLKRLFIALLAFAGLLASAPATAETLSFRPDGSCAGQPAGSDWTWFSVTRPRASDLGDRWQLLVDQTRFRTLELVVISPGADGQVVRFDARAAAEHRTFGNMIALPVNMPAQGIARLCLGFEQIDAPAMMRSVKAMSPATAANYERNWLALTFFVCGVLLCALAYNLFLMFWLKSSFQRWYVTWLAAGLLYTLGWAGTAHQLLGPVDLAWVTRINLVIVSLLIGSATGFFFDFVERDILSPGLVRAGRISAFLVPVCGIAAALDMIVPAIAGDLLLNTAFLVSTLLILVGVRQGIGRGSRAVWFYIAGWSFPLAIFLLRIARNFGLLPQSELVDMAGFIAIALEAVILSLAIADRFRGLQRERDAADAERQTLRRVANTDALTGLPNRMAFQEQLHAIAAGEEVHLLLIDLDHLKHANDQAGHDAGDALIIEVGRRLSSAAPGSFVARIGGDEFALLLRGVAPDSLPAVLSAVECSCNLPFQHNGRTLAAAFSAGLASWSGSVDTVERFYKQADLALYSAKSEGRGCWRRYSPDMWDRQAAQRLRIDQAWESLRTGEFELHYQPIVDLRSGEMVHQEALLRWRHPVEGMIGPDSFRDLFDDPKLSFAIQDRVLELALGRLAHERHVNAETMTVGVNFLAGQLQGEASAGLLLEKLAARGIPPSCLMVEVTENVVLGPQDGAINDCLRMLRAHGVRVALDDFGTGYASLVHLRDLPADVLKIDRTFIADCTVNGESRKIVRAIVALAHTLGRGVIAEGVQTEQQRQYLQRLGCDLGQGYLFGRPEPLSLPAPAVKHHAA